MSKEVKNVAISESDLSSPLAWKKIIDNFEANPEISQELNISDGDFAGHSLMISMHEELDGSGYFQIENVTLENIGDKYVNYCMEYGEVLVNGVYRFYYQG